MSITAEYKIIDPQIYLYLRESCGLKTKNLEAVKIGLNNSLCCVVLTDTETNQLIGMGRLVGDGGCQCQVVDICVLPSYQQRGLGKKVMQKLDEYIKNNLPETCEVTLITETHSYQLYEHYHFASVWPSHCAMAYEIEAKHSS